MSGAEIRFDIGEVLADVVRSVLATGHRRPAGVAFDTHLPSTLVCGDPLELRRGLHDLFDGAGELLAGSLVVCDANGFCGPRHLHVTVVVAGVGVPARPMATDAVLERLAMKPLDAPAGERVASVYAFGRCPHTGADVSFSSLPGEGFIFRFRLVLAIDGDREEQARPDACGAHVWVIDAEWALAQLLARRLQLLGWTTSTFHSAAQALAQLRLLSPGQTLPALVIGIESESVDAAGLHRLGSLLETSRCVLGVAAGSPARPRSNDRLAVDTQVVPFSATDLARLTANLARTAQAPSDHMGPAPQPVRCGP